MLLRWIQLISRTGLVILLIFHIWRSNYQMKYTSLTIISEVYCYIKILLTTSLVQRDSIQNIIDLNLWWHLTSKTKQSAVWRYIIVNCVLRQEYSACHRKCFPIYNICFYERPIFIKQPYPKTCWLLSLVKYASFKNK